MGAKLLYYVVLVPISRMPYAILYALSDLTFFMIYHVFGYRKKVVFKNLRNSFPEKSEGEIKFIGRQFYKHLCDLIVESIKGFTISKKQLLSKVSYKNNDLLESYFRQGRSVVIVASHYNNWELVGTNSGAVISHQALGIYKPLSNKFFDKKMRSSRERFGLIMTPMKETLESMQKDYGRPYALIFAADQAPSNVRKSYWTTFLNQETPVFFGPEKIAIDNDLPVIYTTMNKKRRGHYEVTHQLITDDPKSTQYGEITKAHVKLLEEDIKLAPQYWLWSHKRWKRQRPEDMPMH
ncbi:MAG: lysophospholipid acyltransferase family protein [Flavobacteriales bacterium]|nr:lysophospholipid acyltransferase family protein [Flavobacteriales bacterium]